MDKRYLYKVKLALDAKVGDIIFGSQIVDSEQEPSSGWRVDDKFPTYVDDSGTFHYNYDLVRIDPQ